MTQFIRNRRGNHEAPILVVCDAPTVAAERNRLPMDGDLMNWFAVVLREEGLDPRDFEMVALCPPIPEENKDSASRKWKVVAPHVESLQEFVRQRRPRMIVTFGELASRSMLGRQVKITKARGLPVQTDLGLVLPFLSPGFVMRVPDHEPTFRADIHGIKMLQEAGYDPEQIHRTETDYRWVSDISDLLGENKPRVIAVDTETTGLRWWDPEVVPITVQISTGPGKSVVCCVDEVYWRQWLEPVLGSYTRRRRNILVDQLKRLLNDPEVRKIGQNIKYDHMICRKLGIEINGWLHDTMVMGFAVDENMLSLSLDELVRVNVPEMAGYADEFNASIDKSCMRDVPPDQFLPYAGGDPDATYRLARVLQDRLRKDAKQQRVYRRVQMPAVMAFANVAEPYGIRVDKDKLRELGAEVGQWLQQEYRNLIQCTPVRVRRKHLNARKNLEFSRPEFVKDIMFSQEGFALEPVVFTKSTKKLKDPAKRVPSTSTKDHMPYFVNDSRPLTLSRNRRAIDLGQGDEDRLDTVGDFINRLIDFQKTTKLKSTYYGDEQDLSGFWKYIAPDGNIYPSFGVTFTNTGRTNSRDPNAQNFPKRGSRFAKLFGKVFVPRPGYKFLAVDLSQIELRIAAWMAMETTMLRIYNSGGDIHAATAAAILGIDYDRFYAFKRDERVLIEVANDVPGSGEWLRTLNPGRRRQVTVADFYSIKRFQSKAVNFGFIYGMGWRKFMSYAKTEFGMDVTEQEAQHFRDTFFNLYPGLESWHEAMREFARKHGYVRALHGAVRHLPSIYSNDFSMRSSAERYAINSPVQRFGSDLGLVAFARLSHQADPELMRAVNFVHDQLIVEVREDFVEEAGAALKWLMQSPPLQEWFGIEAPLPIFSDLEVGDSLGDMDEDAVAHVQATKPSWWNDDEEVAQLAFYAVDRSDGVRLAA